MFLPGLIPQFIEDILRGVHQPDDLYKIALYLQSNATDLNQTLSAYTTTGELASGNGYVPGGAILSGFQTGRVGEVAYMNFNDPVWEEASLSADAALIYNASKDNKAMAIIGFAMSTSTNGPFVLRLPPPGALAVITISFKSAG